MNKLLTVLSVIAGIALIVFGLIGLASKSEAASTIRSRLDDVTLARAGKAASDDEFLRSANRAAGFISNIIEGGHKYDIVFTLMTSDGYPVILEQDRIAWDNSWRWRGNCRRQVLADIITDQKVRELYDSGKRVESVSTTISYNWDYCVASVSDNDNDGIVDEKHVSYL